MFAIAFIDLTIADDTIYLQDTSNDHCELMMFDISAQRYIYSFNEMELKGTYNTDRLVITFPSIDYLEFSYDKYRSMSEPLYYGSNPFISFQLDCDYLDRQYFLDKYFPYSASFNMKNIYSDRIDLNIGRIFDYSSNSYINTIPFEYLDLSYDITKYNIRLSIANFDKSSTRFIFANIFHLTNSILSLSIGFDNFQIHNFLPIYYDFSNLHDIITYYYIEDLNITESFYYVSYLIDSFTNFTINFDFVYINYQNDMNLIYYETNFNREFYIKTNFELKLNSVASLNCTIDYNFSVMDIYLFIEHRKNRFTVSSSFDNYEFSSSQVIISYGFQY
jgi:hypothetical protein